MQKTEQIPEFMRYWGKFDSGSLGSKADYHQLAYHSLDVAAVGRVLLDRKPQLADSLAGFLGLSRGSFIGLFTYALALHDLGKFSSAFQAMNVRPLDGLIEPAARHSYDPSKFRHDSLGLYFWKTLLRNDQIQLQSVEQIDREQRKKVLKKCFILLEPAFGHHGKPIRQAQSLLDMEGYTEAHNLEAAKSFIRAAGELLRPEFDVDLFLDKDRCHRLKQVSWHLAGLAVLADWIGSNRRHFEYCSEVRPLSDYWVHSLKTAERAVADAHIADEVLVAPFRSIREHFGYAPTPLQRWAEVVPVDDSPQLFILEDVTGAGKTEAALALTHRLMAAGAADGFYFGLPTTATSNAMFDRVASLYRQMYGIEGAGPSIVLAHGARDMHSGFQEAVLAGQALDGDYTAGDDTATMQCSQWLADSKKKALLAPVGIGTIDQALLAVLPRRHQSLRLLGLNRKVLIFDEVHAADEFMFELLESLLALHLHQGGSAILLTATLSRKQRVRLCRTWQVDGGPPVSPPTSMHFPLATKMALDQLTPLEAKLDTRKDVERTVEIGFLHSFESCVRQVLEAVERGQCVVWVRNSVDDALQAFLDITDKLTVPERCMLFHSRFVLDDRKKAEKQVLATFGKSSGAKQRAGKILISTQVFQESLDADADVMLCDLCPIDDLIQRAGRLHRHTRDSSRSYVAGISDTRPRPKLWVHAPEWDDQPPSDWLRAKFLNTQYVYRSPGRLWLGMQELRRLGEIRMPEHARTLIEAVYGEDAYDAIPQALRNQEKEVIGEERSKAAKAASQVLKWKRYGYTQDSAAAWYEDDSEINTRHSDIQTVEVLLVKEVEGQRLAPWIGIEEFAVQLSCVKLSKAKYADKLAPLPDHLLAAGERLKQAYRGAKYLQLWAPEHDKCFGYNDRLGFHEAAPLVRGTG